MAGYSCLVELTDEDGQVQEIMGLLSPQASAEIIHPVQAFVDGIVVLAGSNSNHFSAISFFQSRAVHFWISMEDRVHQYQN